MPALVRAAPQINQKEVLYRTGVKTLTEEDKSLLQLKLTRAGVNMDPEYFYGLKLAITGLLGVAVITLSLLSTKAMILMPLVLFGFLLPNMWLNNKIERRKAEFRTRLDDFVLYLSTALNSSPGIVLAVGEAGKATGGAWEQEISRVIKENSSGKNFTDALLDMAYRVDEEEVGSLLNLLSQSSNFGGSISNKMQDYADKLREGKRYDIMDRASKLTIKLVFIVTLFILVPVLMAIGFPAAYALMQSM